MPLFWDDKAFAFELGLKAMFCVLDWRFPKVKLVSIACESGCRPVYRRCCFTFWKTSFLWFSLLLCHLLIKWFLLID